VNGTVDDLELELRRLPGVIAVGLDDSESPLRVALFLDREADGELLTRQAELLALVHDPQPVIAISRSTEMTTTITLD
jgi:hypothetical protein